jgi:alpha-tubulin suppressor-like RCC1 family protein
MLTFCKRICLQLTRAMRLWLDKVALTTLFIVASIASAQAPTLVTTELPNGTQNQLYSHALFIGGSSIPYSVNIEGLPVGLTANHNGKGSVLITGTPLVAGSYVLTVSAISEEPMSATIRLEVNTKFQQPPPAIALSAGYSHNCTLIRGSVHCWGDDAANKLGNFSVNVNSISPELISGLSNRVTAISAGWAHTCVVDSGGVLCWGQNYAGQLGSTSDPYRVQAGFFTVTAVELNSGATAISAGHGHSCAVVKNGVQCWGSNASGQLGNNSRVNSFKPVQVIAANSNVSSVSAGGAHSCAIVNDGVQCWGSNASGQLGNNTTNHSTTPVQAIAPNSNVTSLSTGSDHSCAVVNGGVQCWGENFYGQLGNNSRLASAKPVQVIAENSNATLVSAGSLHSCAIVNGGLRCWGHNRFGQLGDGTTNISLTPLQIIAASSGISIVSAGGDHTCAIVNDIVQCWGDNQKGQVGANTYPHSDTPIQASSVGSNVSAFSLGSEHACAVVSGGVRCWGSNSHGQLGNNSTSQSTNPVQAIATGRAVTSISAGHEHSCAIENGGLLCWGANQFGQLGNGSNIRSLIPTQVIPTSSGVTNISAGRYHSCAVVSGGVRCWGINSNGQLGNNSNLLSYLPLTVIPANSGVTGISVSSQHSCAVVAGGVRCWGSNQRGELGNGNNRDSAVPVQTIAENSGVTSVSAGEGHTCAVVRGFAQCWGDNQFYQLGTSIASQSNLPVQSVVENSGVTDISAGINYTCAVVKGGVRCWGHRFFGQHVDRGRQIIGPPQLIPAISGVTNIEMKNRTVCALINGSIVCWGSNAYGQFASSYGLHLTPTNAVYKVSWPNHQNYSGMWWAGEAENGWGISITQHEPSNQQFNSFYVYDASGKPTWYVMPGGSWDSSFTRFTGLIYSTQGSPIDNFVAANVRAREVGVGTFAFTSPHTATFTYTISGTTGSKSIKQQVFGTGNSLSALQVNDLWWGGDAQSGWGLSIAQQGATLFGTWFTYDKSTCNASQQGCTPTWYVMPGGTWGTGVSELTYTGDLYATSGSPWLGVAYNSANLVATKVGTMSIAFMRDPIPQRVTRTSSASMNFSFTAGPYAGVSKSVAIVRQGF